MSTPYHHGNLRMALVEQGLAMLESSDRADLSLRELARQVGVSANAVYRHFANKDALLTALAAEGFRRFNVSQVQAAMGSEDLKMGFLMAGRAYVQFAQDKPALFRLMFSRQTSDYPEGELKEAAQASFDTLLGAVARLTDVPETEERAKVSAVIAWSVVHGLSHLALDGQLDKQCDDVAAFIDEVIARFGASAMP
jgi:AcrR family transcriptional regulator